MARNLKEINWDAVEKQMQAGLTAKQIAHGKIHITHFYRRFKQQFGCDFANYAMDSYECGDGILKFTQYMKAISGKTKELEKLCEVRLGQNVIKQESPPNEDYLTIKHENMILKSELQKIKERLDDDKRKAEQELCGSHSQVQHMGGSSLEWQDIL